MINYPSRKTTAYTQHPQPRCDTIGTELSGSCVNNGFPYRKHHTEPLRGQTKPVRTLNTHNLCVTQLEHNCLGPVLIRVSPYMKHHTKPLRGQTCVTQLEHNCQGPVLIRVSPYMKHHTEPLRGQSKPVRTHNTHNLCVTQLEHNCQGPVL